MEWREPAFWREPVRGVVLGPEVAHLTGIEQLRRLGRGRPPMSHLTGVDLESAEPGEAVFGLPVSDWLCQTNGAVPGGVLCLPADAAMGCALQTLLPARTPYATAELSLTFLRRVRTGDRLRAVGHALHIGRTLGFCDVAIHDGTGERIAHGTSRSTIFPAAEGRASCRRGGTVPSPSGRPEYVASAGDLPDPYLRPLAGGFLGPETKRGRSGRQILEAQIRGELPQPPLHHLLGLVTAEVVGAGVVRVALPMTAWMGTPWGWPQGGFIALLADAALAAAATSATPEGMTTAPVDVKVNFLRPVAGDGSVLTATGRVVHSGRSLAVASADVIDPDGRLVALATGSSAILPVRD